jgi:transcriptional regulator with XRE-family HTH domain
MAGASEQSPPVSAPRRQRAGLEREAARHALGRAIRARRHELGMTLNALAGTAGLSISLLSQVERGLVDPSLESLRDIAYGLDTTPFTLLETGHLRSRVVRHGDGLRLSQPHADVEYELLSPSSDGAFQVAKAELIPGGATMAVPRAHPGEELAMALRGTITLEIGDERVLLREGDAVTFDPRIPHRAIASEDGPATVLYVVSPPVL